MRSHRLKNWKPVGLLIGVGLLFGALALAEGPIPGGTLDPRSIPKYVEPLVIPPAMPLTDSWAEDGKTIEYYEIAVRQFQQQILPSGMPLTTVWSYGSINHPWTFNYPAFTIEARYDRPVRVKWINDLKDPVTGHFLPHILSVDQTLHWANPPGGEMHRDHHGMDPNPYAGPVPIVTHVHGAHTAPESDGYPEAWYLPDATDIPEGYARVGTHYGQFDPLNTEPGTAVFQYPNDQQPTTLWYHDHTLGMTRTNVYAGPAGFFIIRAPSQEYPRLGVPWPAPQRGDSIKTHYFDIPIVIQDRSFNEDGSLFYPDNRAFFEGLALDQLQIPFIPDMAGDSMSDISPIWNPEFFANTMVVNGRTWPYIEVQPRRYRFRFLNGCQSRFLILELSRELPFWQIGAEGGLLPAPVKLDRLLIAPAERADVIIDFSFFPPGTTINLLNLGPDEPFGGGIPGVDFEPADPGTTGQVMQFQVTSYVSHDYSIPPHELRLPAMESLGPADNTRMVSLNELDSNTVFVSTDEAGNIVFDPEGEPFGPKEAELGIVDEEGNGVDISWDHPVTENPALGSTEIWEIHNFTMDAHPIHIHLVQFQVVNREDMDGNILPPEPWETGYKDTVIVYPDGITRVKAFFDIEGLYVWHCHILEHEDNEMMRPYYVGAMPEGPDPMKSAKSPALSK